MKAMREEMENKFQQIELLSIVKKWNCYRKKPNQNEKSCWYHHLDKRNCHHKKWL